MALLLKLFRTTANGQYSDPMTEYDTQRERDEQQRMLALARRIRHIKRHLQELEQQEGQET